MTRGIFCDIYIKYEPEKYNCESCGKEFLTQSKYELWYDETAKLFCEKCIKGIERSEKRAWNEMIKRTANKNALINHE